MQSFMGLGYRLSKNPYWFNGETGEVVQTPGEHHSVVFDCDPMILGIAPDDVASKYSGEQRAIAYADTMLDRGWCRIDIANGADHALGASVLAAGTVTISAPTMEAADAAIREAGRLTGGRADRIIIVVSQTANKTRHGWKSFDLTGHHLAQVKRQGLSGQADAPAMSGHSKMRAGRCPFGFGGRS